jgi:hypothetical protein
VKLALEVTDSLSAAVAVPVSSPEPSPFEVVSEELVAESSPAGSPEEVVPSLSPDSVLAVVPDVLLVVLLDDFFFVVVVLLLPLVDFLAANEIAPPLPTASARTAAIVRTIRR